MWALLHRPRVHLEDSEDVTVLRLTDEPRSASLPNVDHVLSDTHDRDVVVDLGESSSLDGAAWLWVLRLEERVRAWGRSFRLANGLGAPRARARPRGSVTGSPLRGGATRPRPFVNGRIPLRWYGSDEERTGRASPRRR